MRKIIEKSIIEEQLKSGKSKNEIASSLNISLPTLRKLSREYNLNYDAYRPDSKNAYLEIDKEWLIINWINTNKSLPQLAKEYNISMGVLEARRAKYALTKRFKYPIKTEKLFNLNDPNIFYLAGLIATDGYIPKGQDAVELSLTGESELKLLEDIKNYLDLDFPIAQYNNSNRLRITANGLEEFLLNNFNIPAKNKTFEVDIPIIFPSESCAKAYIRGCMDGDGSINKNKIAFSLTTASEKLVSGICNIINTYTGLNISYYYEKRQDRRYPSISIQKSRAKIILDWIYSEPGLRLERKYIRYLKVNDIV